MACSESLQYLEIEIYLDEYFLVNIATPYFGCYVDTVIDEPSAPMQILYSHNEGGPLQD